MVDRDCLPAYLPLVLQRFSKMHGLGNDFVIFDARERSIKVTPALAARLADRYTGIGCDQLILLESVADADLGMTIWNADGSIAEACGNAARCVVALTGAGRIATAGGIVEGAPSGSDVEVVLEPPRSGWDDIPLAYPMDSAALPLAWDEFAGPAAVNVGNPHLVFFVAAIDEQRIAELGPRIEHDPAFPERINVNFAVIEGDAIRLRTFERGAGLTLACGTGACATAVAAIMSRRATSPVTVRMNGGDLVITWAPGEPIRMRGAVSRVFDGEIEFAAFA